MTKTLTCEVCKSSDVIPVLDLGRHPLCDDLLAVGSTDKCEEFQIAIALCKECVTAHQIYPVPKRRLFPSSYHYRSAMTQDVLNGMRGLVEKIKELYGPLQRKTAVDIGCNDGSLLKYFKAEGATILGVEPTSAAKDAERDNIPVINDYFDQASAEKILQTVGHPDFITFTNVFAHIEDIDELLKAVSKLIGPNTRLIVENHYLGAVLERYQFDTFYHEHPRTYSLMSFVKIAERLGRGIEHFEFPSRYGGNIRVVIGPEQTCGNLDEIISTEQKFFQKFDEMRQVIEKWIASKQTLLETARCSDGKVYAKAFPGRAAILVKLLGLDAEDVAAVFEQPKSMKIGNYLPGTRIPIVSDDELLATIPKPRKILNFAWHIHTEIENYLKGLDNEIQCVSIFDVEKVKSTV